VFLSAPTLARQAEIRVVDIGPGLCVVAKFPRDYELLYDAGHWEGSNCYDAVAELVEDGHIEMVVISHPDSDHLGELNEILLGLDGSQDINRAEDDPTRFTAGTILHTGYDRSHENAQGGPTNWREAMAAIEFARQEGAEVVNLESDPLRPGDEFDMGEAKVTFIAGWHEWNRDYRQQGEVTRENELRNVISIVLRVEFEGQSVLLAGDTVGRRLGGSDNACVDAEAFMVRNSAAVPIRSDVLISPHHGADNGNSACFLAEVQPSYMIFSAGHNHDHPTTSAAERAIAVGIQRARMFRTDRGDDEGGFEWNEGRVTGCSDGTGDDDVRIILGDNGPAVSYISQSSGC